MKLFSTKTHGFLDYLTAGTLLVLPRALGWDQKVTSFLTAMGLGTVGYSLLTHYELGLAKFIPMRSHLVLDGMNGAIFCAAPLLFPGEDGGLIGTLVGLGLFEVMTSLTTETEPSFGERASEWSATMGDRVQDLRERIA